MIKGGEGKRQGRKKGLIEGGEGERQGRHEGDRERERRRQEKWMEGRVESTFMICTFETHCLIQ